MCATGTHTPRQVPTAKKAPAAAFTEGLDFMMDQFYLLRKQALNGSLRQRALKLHEGGAGIAKEKAYFEKRLKGAHKLHWTQAWLKESAERAVDQGLTNWLALICGFEDAHVLALKVGLVGLVDGSSVVPCQCCNTLPETLLFDVQRVIQLREGFSELACRAALTMCVVSALGTTRLSVQAAQALAESSGCVLADGAETLLPRSSFRDEGQRSQLLRHMAACRDPGNAVHKLM